MKAKIKVTWHEKTHKGSKPAWQSKALEATQIKALKTNLGKIQYWKDLGP
jgi:hypothetical protein